MACNKKQLEKRTKDHITKISDAYAAVTKLRTEVFMKIIDGVEVYDFMEVRDRDNNLIETDKYEDDKD